MLHLVIFFDNQLPMDIVLNVDDDDDERIVAVVEHA